MIPLSVRERIVGIHLKTAVSIGLRDIEVEDCS
jgi:hypothetical protein